MEDPELIYLRSSEMSKLPRWAMVAFAGRCARRVLPVAKMAMLPVPVWTTVHEATEKLVEEVEKCAATGTRLERGYVEFAKSNLQQAFDSYSEEDRNKAVTITAVKAMEAIHEAGTAAWSLQPSDAAATASICRSAAGSFSEEALAKLTEAQSFDFKLLMEAWTAERWADKTPVSPEIFGPLWRNGRPTQWPKSERDSEDLELQISLEIPEGISDDEVLGLIGETVRHVDSLHRAYGGHGLKIELGDVEIEKPATVPVGGGP